MNTKKEEKGERGFALVTKLLFCPHLNRLCGEYTVSKKMYIVCNYEV